jgi:hypothetical protein
MQHPAIGHDAAKSAVTIREMRNLLFLAIVWVYLQCSKNECASFSNTADFIERVRVAVRTNERS